MNHQMPASSYRQDDRGNQEAVHCLGQLLSSLSSHTLRRSELCSFSIPTSLSLCLLRSSEDVLFVVPLLLPLLRLCKEIPCANKLSVSPSSSPPPHTHSLSLQSPNMVNFLMLLALMTDDHFKSFFLSQQSHVENNFGVCHSWFCRDLIPPYPHTPLHSHWYWT